METARTIAVIVALIHTHTQSACVIFPKKPLMNSRCAFFGTQAVGGQ